MKKMLAIKTKKSKKSGIQGLKKLKLSGWQDETFSSPIQYNGGYGGYEQQMRSAPMIQRQPTRPMIQRHESQMPINQTAPPPSSSPGIFSSISGKFGEISGVAKSPMFLIVTATLVLVGGVYYANSKTGFLTAKPEPEKKTEPEEPVVTEEDRQKWAAEQVALEKVKFRDTADNLREKLGQIHASIQKNMMEARNNENNYKQLFSGSESSDGHDEGLSSMEQESNLNTAFMLKEDLENKKSGMVNLGKELGKQQQYLVGEMNQIKAQLVGLNNEWLSKFPEEDPIFMESATAPDVPRQQMSKEQMAAIEEHRRMQNDSRMMPDAVIDGTGRESIP